MLELQLLMATSSAWANRRQGSVIIYLVEEIRVLKEQLESGGRRLRFTDDQRLRLAAKGKPLGQKVLRQIATIVTPRRSWPGTESSLPLSGRIRRAERAAPGSCARS